MKNALIVSGLLVIFASAAFSTQFSLSYYPIDASECTNTLTCFIEKAAEGHGHYEYKNHCWGYASKVNVPMDVKLVMADGSTVGDELCVGDRFKVVTNAMYGSYDGDGGEYYDEGGFDTPPVVWVNSVTEVVKELIGCPGASSNGWAGKLRNQMYQTRPNDGLGMAGTCGIASSEMTLSLQDSLFEEAARRGTFGDCKKESGPFSDRKTLPLSGSVACGVKTGILSVSGVVKKGDYYEVTGQGDIDLNASTELDCIYYYDKKNFVSGKTSSPSGLGVGAPYSFPCADTGQIIFDPMELYTKVTQNLYRDDAGKNSACNRMNSDWFKAGDIRYSKKVKVLARGTARADLSVTGAENVKTGRESVLKLTVTNTGNVSLTIKDITSIAPHRWMSCDTKEVSPGASVECLLSVTPESGTGLDVRVYYEYKSCGKTYSGQVSKDILSSEIVTPVVQTALQAYRFTVYGSCDNKYYSCGGRSDGSLFSVGYRCFKKDGYYIPGSGRLVLGFDLSNMRSGLDITSASVKITSKAVTGPQKLVMYSLEGTPEQASCTPGGDVCTKPYCAECVPLFDMPADPITEQYVGSPGTSLFDVTEALKKAYSTGGKSLYLQLRGDESVWEKQGESSCNLDKAWAKYDVQISADSGTYLEVVHK